MDLDPAAFHASHVKMPAGPSIIGAATFVGVKLLGYSVAGYVLKRRYAQRETRALAFGVARTLLGIIAGVVYGVVIVYFQITSSEWQFYVWLAPVRLAEWLLIIWLFFERDELNKKRLTLNSVLGSAWSYVLDVPAALSAFVVPGGMWIC